MKTTVSIPDSYHKKLKKIAIDQSTTMAELICQALEEKFFVSSKSHYQSPLPSLPFNHLKGVLKGLSSSPKEVMDLKNIWKVKFP